MTVIENLNPRAQYNGPLSIGDELPITFPYTNPEDVQCVLGETNLQYNIDYTIFEQTLTLKKDVAKDQTITVYRTTPLDQQAEFPQNNKFNSAKMNEALDKICMQQQEQEEVIARCMKVPISIMNFDGAIPVPKAGRALKINTDATGFEMSEFDPDLALVTTEEFKNQAQQAAKAAKEAQAIATNNELESSRQAGIATEQARIAIEQTKIVTEQTEIVTEQAENVTNTAQDALENISTAKNNAVQTITTTKNNAVTEINQEVTDGKKELNNIIEAGGLNINDKITNCILEVPQNIKLELSNGTITLKAGSKVIVPNGFYDNGDKRFDEIIIDRDINNGGQTSNNTWFMCYNTVVDFTNVRTISSSFSGDTQPTSTAQYQAWYDTANNIMKYTADNWATWQKTSLPICICTSANDASYTSIDQVFNGFGYIGKHCFILPNVKGLIPNGRNEDRSLKNIEYTQKYIKLEYLGNNQAFFIGVGSGISQSNNYVEQETEPTTNYTLWYKPSENIMYRKSGTGVVTENKVFVGFEVITGNNGVTSFLPKLPFRAVDYNEAVVKSDMVEAGSYIAGCAMPSNKYIDLTLGASGTSYTAPANGYFNIAKLASSSGQYLSTFGKNNLFAVQTTSTGSNNKLGSLVPVLKDETISITYNAGGNVEIFRFIYAEGDK